MFLDTTFIPWGRVAFQNWLPGWRVVGSPPLAQSPSRGMFCGVMSRWPAAAPPTPFMFQFVTKRFWVLPAVRAAPATSLSSVMRDEEGSPTILTPDLMAATTLPNP